MKSPLGPIEKRQFEEVCLCVCVVRVRGRRETERVRPALFFSIRINHKLSPDASTMASLSSLSACAEVQDFRGLKL